MGKYGDMRGKDGDMRHNGDEWVKTSRWAEAGMFGVILETFENLRLVVSAEV